MFTKFSLVYSNGEALTYDESYASDTCGVVSDLNDKIFTSVCIDVSLYSSLESSLRFAYEGGTILVGMSEPSASCIEKAIGGEIIGVIFTSTAYSFRGTGFLYFFVKC